MKKHKYIYQLFAEDPQTGAGDPAGKAEESKGSENGAEPEKKKTYTDEDIDRIIGDRFKRWQEQKDKEISEAKKLAGMNAQQKAEHERDKLQKELDDLKAEKTRAGLAREARKTLSDGGINIDDDLLALLVAGDAEKTKTSVDSFAKLFNEAVQKAVKEALKGGAPKGGGGGNTLTKEKILAIKDRAERQRLISENIELFR